MGIDIRLPQITGATEKEQLAQVKSYLYQFAEQLQWALQNVNTSDSSVIVQETAKSLYPSNNGSITPKDAQATFAAIKSLIIKSADIIDAYYDEINKKLSGLLVAHSDFGTFVQGTEQTIEANSTKIEQTFTDIQAVATNLFDAKVGLNSNYESLADTVSSVSAKVDTVENDIDSVSDTLSTKISDDIKAAKDEIGVDIQGIKDDLETYRTYIVETNARIKSGLLEEVNGTSVYGIEVGQTNKVNGVEVFNKFARFTADRLSFYDKNGHEVAYISDYKLYITYAEVTGTLKLGGYLIDTANGLTVKWEGKTQEGSE